MGSGYTLSCGTCRFTVDTSGPWEFYRDSKGDLKHYGHPVPASEEAEQAGIHGLVGSLLCADCGRVSEVILVEFKQPAEDALSVWSGRCEPKDEYRQESAVRCPACGGTNLVLAPEEDQKILCPKCKKDDLTCRMDWIS